MRLRSATALLAALMLTAAGPAASSERPRVDAVFAQDTLATEPAIPKAVGFVNDVAGVIDEPTRAKLEGFLDQLKQKTGVEFAVLTMASTAPISPTEYKTQVFQAWGLGKRGEDTGLLMLVAIEEREVRFETGYGLEGTLPDGLQSRIFRNQMAPRFREGDFPGGIVAGVLACAERIGRERNVKLEWDGRELRYSESRGVGSGFRNFLIALIVFLVIAMVAAVAASPDVRGRRRRRGGWYDDWGSWGGGGFGGGFGGGGFGGGSWGGGGGGGGGGSFGGFGGGSSGGGGGGGKW